MSKNSIHIGTSGWLYSHWDKVFYPKKVEKLHYYADFFNTVEINSTFYHLPKASSVKNWKLRVGQTFTFAVKASQYITHRKRLIDCKEPLSLFYRRIHYLKNKLGPLLFQLPPSFKANPERLESFLKLLKKGHLYTFEFRHPSWYTEETYALLRKYQIALCITDITGEDSPLEVTSPFIYIRLHGPKLYTGSYSTKDLQKWKKRILAWQKKGFSIWCYFDNDDKAYAVKDALRLMKMVY